jgi:PIN domain nuclease of toxin-antitoxin system
VKALLDTHILLWWLAEDPRLSLKQRQILEGANPENPLCMADITLWEIATLYSLKRIKLHLPLREWLEQATAPPLIVRLADHSGRGRVDQEVGGGSSDHAD